ncbi:MAG TPA: H-X9-DG-CTERM domain-containing protein [Humisphaera sp.]
MTAHLVGRRPTIRLWVFGLLACCAASAATVRAQPLADQVPADAVVYVGSQGFESKGAGYAGSHLEGVMKAGDVQALVDQTLPQLLDKLAQKDRGAAEVIGIAMPILKPLAKYPAAFWVGTPTMAANQAPVVRAGLIVKAGAEAGALHDHLARLMESVPQDMKNQVKLSKTADTVIVAANYAANDVPAAGGGLAGSAGFAAVKAHMVPNASFAVYVDVAAITTLADTGVATYTPPDHEARQMWPKLRDAIGMAGVKHFVWTSGFDGKEWADHAFLHAPEPRAGLVALADPTPVSDEALKAIPMTATLAGASRFDLSRFVGGLRQAAVAIEPRAAGDIDRAFAEASRKIGMDVEKDLIGLFGPEWVYYVDPMTGGRGTGGMVLLNKLRDPARGEASLSKLEGLINDELAKNIKEKDVSVRFLTTKSGETTIHYLGTPLLSPAWAVKGGYLIVGLYPQMVAGAADQFGAAKSILDNPAYQAVRARLGAVKANGVTFMDLPKTAPDGYATWVAVSRLTGFAEMFGVKSPAMVLPPLNKLMPHLTPAGSVTWTDADGIHFKMITPFPGATLIATDPLGNLVGSAPALMGVMLPALQRTREQANRIKSASNLRYIAQTAMIMQNERPGGRFPAKLSDLLKGGDLSPSVLVNPRREDPPPPPAGTPEQVAAWADQSCGYVWVGDGRRMEDGPGTVIAYERPDGLTDGINFAYADGHVEFIPMFNATDLIERARKHAPGGGAAPAGRP